MQNAYKLRLDSTFRELCLNLEHLGGWLEARAKSLFRSWEEDLKPGHHVPGEL